MTKERNEILALAGEVRRRHFFYRETPCQMYFYHVRTQNSIMNPKLFRSVDSSNSKFIFHFSQRNAEMVVTFKNPELEFPNETLLESLSILFVI